MNFIKRLVRMLQEIARENFQTIQPSAQIAKRVRSAQLEIAIQESRLHFLGAIASVSFCFWVFYQPDQPQQAFVWWGCAIPLLVINYYLQWHVFKNHKDKLTLTQWEWVVFFMYAGWGSLWALAPWLFLPGIENAYVLLIMLLILIALCVTVIIAAAAYPAAYLVLAVPILCSGHIYFLRMDTGVMTDTQALIMDWLIPFFALFLTLYMFKLRKTLQANTVLHLENEQANINKSQFLAAASHDIRQPLQASHFYWENLHSELKGSKSYEKLGSCLNNLSDLLDNLLDVSRLDAQVIPNHPRHIDLQQIINIVIQNFNPIAKEKGIQLTHPDSTPCVYADPILLERILINLVSNAINYTNSGSVSITCSCVEGKVSLAIEDTGIGIPLDEQEAIFDEFYQLNNPERSQSKGLGLGLSIVKRISKLMKCPVTIRSAPGEGSKFSLELKIGNSNKIESSIPTENILEESLQVLVVDDEEMIRDSLQTMLERWNMRCVSFESSQQATTHLIQTPDWTPDCIVSDYRLKDNKTGSDAIAAIINQLGTEVPAILLTGDTHPQRIHEAQNSGYAVVHKPIKPAFLRTAISIATTKKS